MSGPYTLPKCDDCEQYQEQFCHMHGVCKECCSEWNESGECYE